MCATKNRQHRVGTMLESFKKFTSEDTHLALYVQKTSNQTVNEYEKLLEGYDYEVNQEIYQSQVFNYLSTCKYPDYEYYGMINDDHIIHTQDWDRELMQTVDEKGHGWGLAHANDLWPGSSVECNHPSCAVMSGNIVRHFGYYALPSLRHFAIDDYLRDITEPLGIMFFRKDVVVEHMHPHNKHKAEMDDNYRWIYGKEEMQYGHENYTKWALMFKHDEIMGLDKVMQDDIKQKENGKWIKNK